MLLLCLFTLLAAPAHAQSFPAFTGLVVDAANVLPPEQEAAITRRLETLQQTSGTQLVVATIPDLEGRPIDDYGYRLGRAWAVGLKDADNGAILIVAPNDRQVRIEVGRGLEPTLTDAVSSLTINGQILPRFRDGDIPGGIAAGANALADFLATPDAERQAKVDAAAAEFDRTHRRGRAGGDDGGGFMLVFWGIVALFVLLTLLRGRGRRQRGMKARRYGGSDWPIVMWMAADALSDAARHRGGGGGGWGGFGGGGGGSDGSWGGGGFTGGGGGDFGGGGASGSW